MKADIVVSAEEQKRLIDLGDRVFPAFETYRKQAPLTGRDVPIVQLSPTG